MLILQAMLFTYPTFLFALFALSIPVAIHMFQLRRFKKIVFSDIRFLKSVDEQTRSNRKIKEWLILACRLLGISALVLAFAQPYLPAPSALNKSEQKFISLYIDNSPSMQLEGSEGTLLEEAKQKARAVIDAYPKNTLYHIVTNTESHGSWQALSATEAKDYVAGIQPESGNQNFEKTLEKQRAAAERFQFSNPEFYYLSDFQQTQWNSLANIPHDSLTYFHFVHVRAQGFSNISIDSAWLESLVVKVNSPVGIRVRLTNHQNSSAVVSIQLLADGLQKGIQSVSLEANQKETLVFPFTPDENKPYRLTFSIRDHPISFDDELYMVIHPKSDFDVLCINGNTTNTYIEALFQSEPSIKFTQCSQNQIDFASLPRYALIVLNECHALPSGTQTELARYMSDGGTVLHIPAGEPKQALSNNSWFGELNAPTYSGLRNQAVQVNFVETGHALLKQAFTKIPKNTDWPGCSQYFAMNLQSNVRGKSILGLNSGDALLWQTSVGKGSLLILSVALSDAFTNLHKHALFVPLMLNMVTLRTGNIPMYYTCGASTRVTLPLKSEQGSEKTIQLTGKERSLTTSAVYTNGAFTAAIPPDMSPGFYRVSGKSQTANYGDVAVNENRTESSMTFYEPGDLQEFSSAFRHSTIHTEESAALFAGIQHAYNGKPLWRWFLLISLLALLAEMSIIRYMKN